MDGDVLSRQLTAAGGAALPAIRAAFGDGVFQPDGTLHRRALGNVVFSDPSARAKLDGIMQPMLRQMILSQIASARQRNLPTCVLDMPLLYEQHLETLCDTVWCVALPEAVQLERLMQRDGLTQQEALARMGSQMPVSEKAARAQRVLDNSGTPEELRELTRALYAQEIALQEARQTE